MSDPTRGLPALIKSLESHGITVTHADAYRAALHALQAPAETPVPAGLLTMAPADLAAHLRDRAVNDALNKSRRTLARPVVEALTAEMAASMRLEVDSYLDVMRPKFNAAAAAAHAVLAAGVRPGLTAEGALEAGMDVAAAWQEWHAGAAVGALQRTANLRVTLAQVLDLGEGGDGDHAIGVTSPWVRHGLVPAHRDEDPLDRWLILAPRLDLVPFADLDPEDYHEARGGTPFAEVRKMLDARERRAG